MLALMHVGRSVDAYMARLRAQAFQWEVQDTMPGTLNVRTQQHRQMELT